MNTLFKAHLQEGNAPSLPRHAHGNDGPSPSKCSRLSVPLATLCLLVASAIPSPAVATELETIAGARITLAEIATTPKTLVLVASAEPDLREGFRILSLAYSRQLPALLLVTLPENQPLQTAAIKKTARRFLDSDFSRQRILYVGADELLPFEKARAFVIDQNQVPLWQARDYPTDADFDTSVFQP